MKTVTLLGQSYNAGVADAGVTTVATRIIDVANDLTYNEFSKSDAYRAAAQELKSHPVGVDYVAVKAGTPWPMHSFSSSSINAAGELHA